MFPDGFRDKNHDEISRFRPWHTFDGACSMKKRKRNTSVPVSLQLFGDSCDETDDGSSSACDSEDEYRRRRRSRRPPPVPWSDELHQKFVRAILEIGIEKSSPAIIAEQMITKNNYNDEPTDAEGFGKCKGTPKKKRKARSSVKNSPSDSATDSIVADVKLTNEQEYYKRELTGERLKSHLQKVRKGKDREMQVFLEDHQRVLRKERAIDRRKQELQKQEEYRRELARKRRRQRQRKHKDKELLNASTADIFDKIVKDEDVTHEEEERLLSMYLPLPNSSRGRNGITSEEIELEHALNEDTAAFPAGGGAIGRVTWAVQQQVIENQKKRLEHCKRKQQRIQHLKKPQQQLLPLEQDDSNLLAESWETASVNSWTSDTANAAAKVASALGCVRRGEETTQGPIKHCGSSEDGFDDDSSDEENEDLFREAIPTLTEAEKKSPLGVSMMLAWDMIKHMHGVIAEQRLSQEKQQQQQVRNIPSASPLQKAAEGSPEIKCEAAVIDPESGDNSSEALDRGVPHEISAPWQEEKSNHQRRPYTPVPSPVPAMASATVPNTPIVRHGFSTERLPDTPIVHHGGTSPTEMVTGTPIVHHGDTSAGPSPGGPGSNTNLLTTMPITTQEPSTTGLGSNPNLLAAMAATGPPPSSFMMALGNIFASDPFPSVKPRLASIYEENSSSNSSSDITSSSSSSLSTSAGSNNNCSSPVAAALLPKCRTQSPAVEDDENYHAPTAADLQVDFSSIFRSLWTESRSNRTSPGDAMFQPQFLNSWGMSDCGSGAVAPATSAVQGIDS